MSCLFVALAYGVCGRVFYSVFYTPVTNDVMLQQMDDSSASYVVPACYDLLMVLYPYGWVLIAALLVAVWRREIVTYMKGRSEKW